MAGMVCQSRINATKLMAVVFLTLASLTGNNQALTPLSAMSSSISKPFSESCRIKARAIRICKMISTLSS